MTRPVLLFIVALAALAVTSASPAAAQGFQIPGGENDAASGGFTSRGQAPPATGGAASGTATSQLGRSQPSRTTGNGTAGGASFAGGGALPQTHGQEYRVYDLRPYTGYLTKMDRPQEAVVDWILKETGEDAWFHEPMGLMNASRDKLHVYHTPEMHQVVNGIVQRFVAGEKDPQVINLNVVTVGNPNWRARAHLLMQHVNVDSPGVQAWLLTKENAAIIRSQLQARTDVRQVQALDMIVHNGQTERLASTRGRNYIRNVRQAPTGWPPYEPETGEVQEGYKLEISPLLSVDGGVIDCVIKANIDQVDKLVPVDLDLPLPNAQTHRARIDVPQVVSWRLHERFRWPADMVLLLSCGVVASPERAQSTIPLFNTNMFTGTTAGRADALMFIRFRGRASENLTTTPLVPQVAAQPGAPNRGRY